MSPYHGVRRVFLKGKKLQIQCSVGKRARKKSYTNNKTSIYETIDVANML